ncbi:hypothetical protein KC317_g19440, partial [Hortaea werneckii]
MAAPYINTPGTERGDVSSISQANLDMSFAQPFASPSKNAGENLRNHMKGMRGPAQSQMKTPRMRNALVDRRNANGPARQEFTPLLKSAQRNQMLQRSILEDKENDTKDDAMKTPAGFRSSYASEATQLPMNSSMIDGDDTGSSGGNGNGDRTPAPPATSSSMIDSTPMPQDNKQNKPGILDHGNALTLRDQEAKLDQIQKDNFGLKLKIHFLEEALRKSGTQFQQQTLKENVELKTEKMTLEHEFKKNKKRLQDANSQMEDYKQSFEDYKKAVKSRHANERDAEELDRLQNVVEEKQREAEEREEELERIRRKLDEAEKNQGSSEEAERLRDDVQDLEADVRDRERQLEEKDDQLESLREQLKSAKNDTEQAEGLQRDIDELEKELEQKDAELKSSQEQLRSAK